MKIWGEIPKIFGVYNKQKSVGKVEKADGVAAKKDVIQISSQARDFQAVQKALKSVPDVRRDKVDGLLDAYQSGNYDVKGSDVADRIIKSVYDRKI